MDRDNARAFINRMVDEEKKFIASLEEHKTSMENTEDWQNTMKNFAPTIKAFYNTQLESWSRFYLGLDCKRKEWGPISLPVPFSSRYNHFPLEGQLSRSTVLLLIFISMDNWGHSCPHSMAMIAFGSLLPVSYECMQFLPPFSVCF